MPQSTLSLHVALLTPRAPLQPPRYARRVLHDQVGYALLFFTPALLQSLADGHAAGARLPEGGAHAARALLSGGPATLVPRGEGGGRSGAVTPAEVALWSTVPYLVTSIVHGAAHGSRAARMVPPSCARGMAFRAPVSQLAASHEKPRRGAMKRRPAYATLPPLQSCQRVPQPARWRAATPPGPLLAAGLAGAAGHALCPQLAVRCLLAVDFGPGARASRLPEATGRMGPTGLLMHRREMGTRLGHAEMLSPLTAPWVCDAQRGPHPPTDVPLPPRLLQVGVNGANGVQTAWVASFLDGPDKALGLAAYNTFGQVGEDGSTHAWSRSRDRCRSWLPPVP